MVQTGALASTVLWGPPGCGKTTIARLLADHTDMLFEPLSAVFSGVAELRKVFAEARSRRRAGGTGTLLFVDEIHRFNRAQQDAFLPVVEDGTVILVGATTENPSFELNGALLSRCAVLVLNRLDDGALETLLARAEAAEGRTLPLEPDARIMLRAMADGDGRALINMAEALFAAGVSRAPGRACADGDGAAPRAALRQVAGRPLQPDLGAAQVAARLGHRRCALLARAHAGGRRGPPLHRPPPGALRRRGRRASPTPTRCPRRSPAGRPTSGWARPRASSPSPRP